MRNWNDSVIYSAHIYDVVVFKAFENLLPRCGFLASSRPYIRSHAPMLV